MPTTPILSRPTLPASSEHQAPAANAQAPGHSGLVAQVHLPKSTFRLADLATDPQFGFRNMGPAVTEALNRPFGVTVPQPAEVRLSIAAGPAPLAPLTGVQVGLFARVVQVLVALVVAIYRGVLTLVGQRPAEPQPSAQAPAASRGAGAGPVPLQLQITPSVPLKATLNGVPAWLAHQQFNRLTYNALGQGTLEGPVKLFNLFSLPPLTSPLYSAFGAQLRLPQLDLNLAQVAAVALAKAYPLGDAPFFVSQDPTGRLLLHHVPQSAVPSPWGAPALRMGLPEMHLEATDQGFTGRGAIEAEVGDADTLNSKVKVQWELQLNTKAQALSEAALLKLEGSFSRAPLDLPPNPWATADAEQQPLLGRRQLGAERVAAWAGLTHVTMHLAPTGHSTLAALRAQDELVAAAGEDDDELSSLSNYETASEGSELEEEPQQAKPLPLFTEPLTQSPLSQASTPTLVAGSSTSPSRTPSLLTLNDEELAADFQAGQEYLAKG